jgi:hypothetical protein
MIATRLSLLLAAECGVRVGLQSCLRGGYRVLASISLWPMRNLYGPGIRTRFKQMRGKAMAKRVWSDVSGDACPLGGFLHRLPDDLWGDRFIGAPAVFGTRK